MHFYDCSTAPSPRRARVFIAEKGLEIPTTDISIAKGEQMTDEFRKINPHCTLPALVTDDGVTLTQNIGIATYLERKFPDPALMGRTPAETGEIMDWAAIAEQQGGMATAEALRNSNPHMKGRALPGPDNYEQIPELAERGLARAARFQELMERRMQGREWVVGDQISYADITAFVLLDFQRIIKLKIDESKPALFAWYSKMRDRPSAQL